RLRGEFLHTLGAEDGDVEAALRRAIEIARAQRARSLELRATASLARVQAARGRPGEPRVLLQRAHGPFPPGFHTPALPPRPAAVFSTGPHDSLPVASTSPPQIGRKWAARRTLR